MNANFGRDFETMHVGDISRIREGNLCLQCGESLSEIKAVELGHIFKLGDYYSRKTGLYFQDDNARRVFPVMGAYGIGIGRLMTSIVEANHDDKGIIWPESIAPFKIYLMGIGESLAVKRNVEKIYKDLGGNVLLDDRKESPGVKFKDADLLGIPYRIIISRKNLEKDQVEIRSRLKDEVWTSPLDSVVSHITELPG